MLLLISYLKKKKRTEFEDFLISFFTKKLKWEIKEIEVPSSFEKIYNNINEIVNSEDGEKLKKLSPFLYSYFGFLSLKNPRANLYLALKLLEEKIGTTEVEIKRRQYSAFFIYAIIGGEKKKIFTTTDRKNWLYWSELLKIAVQTPEYYREWIKNAGKDYYKYLTEKMLSEKQ
jgi:hypothetical protein